MNKEQQPSKTAWRLRSPQKEMGRELPAAMLQIYSSEKRFASTLKRKPITLRVILPRQGSRNIKAAYLTSRSKLESKF